MDKQLVPKTLRKWLDHEFSSGCYTGDDYKSFERSYAIWLRKALAGYDVKMYKNHYEFSAVITKKGKDGDPDKHVYLSISDVRCFRNEWAGHVLMRTMAHAEDWTGGTNTYCRIDQIRERADALSASF